MKAVLLLASFGCLLGVAVSRIAEAETRAVVPEGEYTQIDTRLANETMQILAGGTVEEKREAIERIKASPGRYAPPIFYLLSSILFEDGQEEEGAFWFYAGQLRAREDEKMYLYTIQTSPEAVTLICGTVDSYMIVGLVLSVWPSTRKPRQL